MECFPESDLPRAAGSTRPYMLKNLFGERHPHVIFTTRTFSGLGGAVIRTPIANLHGMAAVRAGRRKSEISPGL